VGSGCRGTTAEKSRTAAFNPKAGKNNGATGNENGAPVGGTALVPVPESPSMLSGSFGAL